MPLQKLIIVLYCLNGFEMIIPKMTKYLLSFIILSFLLTSCVTSKRVNLVQDPNLVIPSYKKDTLLEAYKLQVGDRVSIIVNTLNDDTKRLFSSGGQAMMSTSSEMFSYTIYSDSCVNFPFVGRVKVAGYSVREARDVVKKSLLDIAPDCDVDVRLVNSFFTIVGDAANGRFPIPKEKLNVFQVLAMSGGLNAYSDRAKIHILRPTANGTITKVFDIRSKDIIDSEFYYVRPNDVIYVRSFNGQFFQMGSFSTILSTIMTSLSFGYLIYDFSTNPPF